MADRRHAITQLDFFIRQVTLFADEIRNAVGQKLDVLGFKTTGRDLGEQMAFGFLLEFLQKVVVIVCDRFAGHRIQCLGKALLGETVCIRQALGQGLFHFIGKLPVRRMNLFASSLAYIKEIVKGEFGIPIDTNSNALCTGNQISAYHCKLTGSWRISLPKLHLTWVGIALHLLLAVLICGECSAQVVLAHPV